ncbi:MAG TPA: FBP domain-containing protein [Pseudonocardiaceae bacterium]|nr:FBP domain-containing protein [Pseudonocardiaceae bacterium]
MRALRPDEIRASFVNCSRGEAKRLTLPGESAWADIDFLSWVDPRAEHNAYLVVPYGDGLVGVALRSTVPPQGRTRSGMCGWCLTTLPASEIALFSARKAGAAGRAGATLGTYACRDLACGSYVRSQRKPAIPQPAETLSQEDRIARLTHKVTRFVDQVLAG